MKNSRTQESQTASPSLLSHRPANSGSTARTLSGNESQVPYEEYLQMSEAERAAIPYERKPYRLTPSEIASLRQDSRDSLNWMREQLGLPQHQTV